MEKLRMLREIKQSISEKIADLEERVFIAEGELKDEKNRVVSKHQ